VIGKLFRSFRNQTDDGPRKSPTTVGDLRPGDILTFKQRRTLPDEMQGGSYEVAAVSGYQYEDGLYTQITLVGQDRRALYLGFDPRDDEGELCWSKPISRSTVLELFDEETFADLWEDGFTRLETLHEPADFFGWLTGAYQQTKNQAIAYYFDQDMRDEHLSKVMDDNSEELRYHECTGSDDRFSITVEVWADGETEVTLDVVTPSDVIETIFPAE